MTEKEKQYFEIMLEQILHEVKIVAEGHAVLRNEIKDSHRELENKIDLNASVIKFGFETLDARIDSVRSELKADIQGVRTELKETRDELSAGIAAVGAKVDGHDDRIRFLERKLA